jgi:glycosyltransferase involved in cell wall biosynthesis
MQKCDAAGELSWSLVIATYNRPNVLKISIELALKQSRPPKEVIIVDASEYWRETRDQILSGNAANLVETAGIKFIYAEATTKSITCQRNQGLGHATSDVVFFFDDDTLMFPDCAEQIMGIYEEDASGALVGVGAFEVPEMPIDIAVQDERKVKGASRAANILQLCTRRIQDFLRREVILFDSKKVFIPYDGEFYTRALPASIKRGDVSHDPLLVGFRMTFRRWVVEREKFESLLMGYCPAEDLDFSYRASRHGALASVATARVHHYESASGRTDRYKVTVLTALNGAMLLRKNAVDLSRCKRKFWILTARRIFAELLKDGFGRRWSFPQLRGMMDSINLSRAIFRMSPDDLSRRYPQMQINLFNGRRVLDV